MKASSWKWGGTPIPRIDSMDVFFFVVDTRGRWMEVKNPRELILDLEVS